MTAAEIANLNGYLSTLTRAMTLAGDKRSADDILRELNAPDIRPLLFQLADMIRERHVINNQFISQ